MTKYRKSVNRFKSRKKVTKRRKYKTRKNKIKKIKTHNKSKMQKGGNLQDFFILAEQYYDQLPPYQREYATDDEMFNVITDDRHAYVDDSVFYQRFVDVINGLYEDDIRNGYNHMLPNITYVDLDEYDGNLFDAIHGVPEQCIVYAIMQHTDNNELPSQYSDENATACKIAMVYYIMLLPIYERFEDQNAYIDNLEHTFDWFRENNMLK